MDWKIPELRFKHLIKVKSEVGLDLADLEDCAELDNIRQLGLVLEVLSPVWSENDYHGEAITDAHHQLMDRLKDFFPQAKRELLGKMLEAIQEAYQTASGLPVGS